MGGIFRTILAFLVLVVVVLWTIGLSTCAYAYAAVTWLAGWLNGPGLPHRSEATAPTGYSPARPGTITRSTSRKR